jgi:hypothetical protein
MRKASTRLPEQGTQAPSPAPDLIPAETENQPRTYRPRTYRPRTYREIGTVNRGTSKWLTLVKAVLVAGAVLFVMIRWA